MRSQRTDTMGRRQAGAVLAAILASAAGLGGCDLGMTEEDDGAGDPAPMDDDPDAVSLISMNSLRWESLSATFYESRSLINSTLNQSPVTAALADTREGLEVLRYATTCALPAGEKVGIDNNYGDHFEFYGKIGVARDWPWMRLDQHQVECLGGCLAAHLNGLGSRIAISARGDACGYTVDAADRPYAFEEGGFAADNELTFYVCTGRGLEKACGNAAVPTLLDRLCTRGDPRCGDLVVMGSCESVCKGWSEEGGYRDCAFNRRRLTGMTTVNLEGGLPYPCSM